MSPSLYHRSTRKNGGFIVCSHQFNVSDLFGMLSDEIVLMIMQWLPRQSLSDCALVCQRWRRIVYDESLWQRIDLTCMSLKTDHMGYVLQRNPIILRMAQAEVKEGPNLINNTIYYKSFTMCMYFFISV